MVSNDPDFESQGGRRDRAVPEPACAHAAVFCVDEKTAIQALDRKDRMLPLSPGRAESHGFEYKRNGTLSLFAALNTATGEVLGKTAAAPHQRAVRRASSSEVVASQPEQPRDPCDLRQRQQSQDRSRRGLPGCSTSKVSIHYTPTYSSWLNQVENWFSRIQRDVISRGIFTSVKDLDKKLMRYIREHNKSPKPIKWKYNNPNRRHHQLF